jgi:hypothetical protein
MVAAVHPQSVDMSQRLQILLFSLFPAWLFVGCCTTAGPEIENFKKQNRDQGYTKIQENDLANYERLMRVRYLGFSSYLRQLTNVCDAPAAVQFARRVAKAEFDLLRETEAMILELKDAAGARGVICDFERVTRTNKEIGFLVLSNGVVTCQRIWAIE